MGAVTDNLNAAWAYTVDNCTRFVAGVMSWIPPGLGDAKDWLANARAKGLPTIGPTSSPPAGSVAVWGTGAFGHVAAVTGRIPGGFTVREENFRGLGVVDDRRVTGDALGGLQGFILAPGSGSSDIPVVGGVVDAATAAAGLPGAIAGLPASVGHGLANAGGAIAGNIATFFKNQAVPLVVGLVVAIVLFGGDESK